MKIKSLFILFFFIAFIILVGSSHFVLADELTDLDDLGASGNVGGSCPGLVPCGCSSGPPCNICHIFTLLQRVLNFLWWYISVPLATLMLAYAGFLLMIPSLGSGSAPMITKGKKVLKNTVVGIMIVFFSWLFIDTIIKVIAGQNLGSGKAAEIGGWGPWNEVKCDASKSASIPFKNNEQPIFSVGNPEGTTPGGAKPIQPKTGEKTTPIDGTGYTDGYPLTPAIVALSVPPEGTSLRNPSNTQCVLPAIQPYSSLIDQAATQYGVNANRLRAIMITESSGNPNAKSNDNDGKSSYGLMQIRPETARILDPAMANQSDERIIESLKNPQYNIKLGTKYYSALLQKYNNNVKLASAAYNGGPIANNPSVNCPGLRRWQCLWDDNAHTVPNERSGHPGYGITRKYVDKIDNFETLINKNQCNFRIQ